MLRSCGRRFRSMLAQAKERAFMGPPLGTANKARLSEAELMMGVAKPFPPPCAHRAICTFSRKRPVRPRKIANWGVFLGHFGTASSPPLLRKSSTKVDPCAGLARTLLWAAIAKHPARIGCAFRSGDRNARPSVRGDPAVQLRECARIRQRLREVVTWRHSSFRALPRHCSAISFIH
jgi:hypothetical protein